MVNRSSFELKAYRCICNSVLVWLGNLSTIPIYGGFVHILEQPWSVFLLAKIRWECGLKCECYTFVYFYMIYMICSSIIFKAPLDFQSQYFKIQQESIWYTGFIWRISGFYFCPSNSNIKLPLRGLLHRQKLFFHNFNPFITNKSPQWQPYGPTLRNTKSEIKKQISF